MCSDRLQECFNFKIACLNNDTQVKALHNCKDVHPLNLEQILPKQELVEWPVKNGTTKVCRLCLKGCVLDSCIELNQMNEDFFFKDLICKSFPEVVS